MTNPGLYIVAVTGGRDYGNNAHVYRVLREIHSVRTIDVLAHGGCGRKHRDPRDWKVYTIGADLIADAWAVANLVQSCEFRVPDEHWNRIGRSAGPSRNRRMLECAQPNLLVAFPGGTGTASCVAMAKRLGIELRDERKNG